MPPKYIVALDQGSSSSRALIVDARGQIVAQAACPVETLRPMPGYAELDGDKLWAGQLAALEKVLQQIDVKQVAALAISSQRSTVVFWDRFTGKALAPALSWQDGRAVKQSETLSLPQQAVHQLTGLYNTPFYAAAKIKWTFEKVSAVSRAAKENRLCVGPVASYLIWHLTEGKTFATDASLAQRMLLFDVNNGNWSDPLCQVCGISKTVLPEIKFSADDYGIYTYQGVHLPIVVCTGDQQAAAYWTDLAAGQAGINYGTGAFLLYNTGKKPVFLPGMLTSVGAGTEHGKNYFLEGPVNAAGTIFQWLNAQGISFSPNEINTLCMQAQHPVQLLPALGGLGAPYWDFKVSAVAENLSPLTRKADWVAGATRGLVFLLADIVTYLQKNGCSVRGSVAASGGLSQIDYLMQFQSDILQKPLVVSATPEATLLGAAKLAACRLGWQTDSWCTQAGREFVPKLDAQKAVQEHQAWQIFLHRCCKK